MKGKITKKIAKLTLWVIGILLSLDLLLVSVLFLPRVQNFVIHTVTHTLSEQWGTELSIGQVYLTPSLRVIALDVNIEDTHGQPMIFVDQVKARLTGLKLKPLTLSFASITVYRADVALVTYKGEKEINISLWAKQIAKPKPNKQGVFILKAKRLALVESRFSVSDLNRIQPQHEEGQELDPAFFELRHLVISAKNFQVKNDDISGDLKKIAFDQYIGFRVKQLSSSNFHINKNELRLENCKIETENSRMDLDLLFSYNDWSNLGDFLDSVNITAKVRPSYFNIKDAACYGAAIRGMNNTILIDGQVDGCVNNLSLSDFTCHYGIFTYFSGNFAATNLTRIKDLQFALDFDQSNINMTELSSFLLPMEKPLPIPNIAHHLGNVKLHGQIEGNIPSIYTNLDIQTDIGGLMVNLEPNETETDIAYTGFISTSDLNIGKLLNSEKILGTVAMDMNLNANINKEKFNHDILDALTAELSSQFSRFDLFGYPVAGIQLDGFANQKQFNAHLTSPDPNCKLLCNATLDLSRTIPNLMSQLSVDKINFAKIAKYYPTVDSATAKGIDKLLYVAQQTTGSTFTLDTLFLDFIGLEPSKTNGYLAMDGLKIFNDEGSIESKRLRFTAINPRQSDLHQFILSSNIANAMLKTNYELDNLVDSVIAMAYKYIPNLLTERKTTHLASKSTQNQDKFFDFSLETYATEVIFYLFAPQIDIDEHCTAKIHFDNSNSTDYMFIHIPYASYNKKYNVNNLNILGINTIDGAFHIELESDSVTILDDQNTPTSIKDIGLRSNIKNTLIDFQVSLRAEEDANIPPTILAGTFDARNRHNMIFKIDNSDIYIDGNHFKFNNNNSIVIKDDIFQFNHVAIGNGESFIKLDGTLSNSIKDQLTASVRNWDLSIANHFLQGISFGGDMSANINISKSNNKFFMSGKTLITQFNFNGENFGNCFVTAGLDNNGYIGFSGGLFETQEALKSSIIDKYNIRNFFFAEEPTAIINGYYAPKERTFEVKANINTIKVGFLEPFLSSFSDKIQGHASGQLTFTSSPKSSYIDGTVHIDDMKMGISALGTVYHIQNQDLKFNNKGIIFNKIQMTDKDGNIASLDGYIYHNLFQDIKINLEIDAPRILALDLPKSNESFYGTGYVSGKIKIKGDESKLVFSSNNVKTLSGSSIVFVINSTQSVSESGNIRFKKSFVDTTSVEDVKAPSMNLVLDFNFDVTQETDVQVDVQAIGGTLRCKTEGRMHMICGIPGDIDIYGKLEVTKGTFLLALEDIVNTKLTLVRGGTVTFDGPLADFNVNISAYHTAKTSLSNIAAIKELGVNTRTTAKAIMHINGELMRYPNLDFSFDLPDASQEVKNIFYMVIDTVNPQNRSKQFFIFLLTNQFMPDNAGADEISSSVESGGINLVTNMIGNFISKQFKKGDFGITYKNGDSKNAAAEYGINANIPFLNDRMIFETNLGYYDNRRTSSGSQGLNDFYGNFSLEYLITERGTWRVKVYNFNDQYNTSTTQNIQGVGLGLMYKQEFNNKHDFTNEFKTAKITTDKSKKKKKNKKEKQDSKS